MMLINDLITYNPELLAVAGMGVLGLVLGVIYTIAEHKIDSMTILFYTGGLLALMFSGSIIYTGNVTHTTITPCSISEDLVADQNDNIYVASDENILKLHLNQTREVTIESSWIRQRIVDVPGKICQSGVNSGC